MEVVSLPAQQTWRTGHASPPAALAIIIPTLNEAPNIQPLIEKLEASLWGRDYEIVIVDDWSSDGTAGVVTALARTQGNVRLIRRFGRSGLSSAVIEGALSTCADVVAVFDADLQHDETVLPALLDLVASGTADLAIGSRYVEGGSCGAWRKDRALMSRASTWIAERALPIAVRDPMSGFFAMRADRFRDLVPKLRGTGFKLLFEILMASPPDIRITEVPYIFRPRLAGVSKLGPRVAADYAAAVVNGLIGRHLAARLAAYGTIGLLGLGVHLTVLRLLLGGLDVSFVRAQTTAVIAAIGFNFTLNNRLTFRDRSLRGRRLFAGLVSFYVICGVGAIANVGVGSLVYADRQRWWLAGIAGAMVGSVWNFAAAATVTWRRR